MTRSAKFVSIIPPGDIIVDNNAGAIIEKYKTPEGVEVIETIPVSALTGFSLKIGTSEVSLSYSKMGDDGNEEETNLTIVVPINPEGVRINPVEK